MKLQPKVFVKTYLTCAATLASCLVVRNIFNLRFKFKLYYGKYVKLIFPPVPIFDEPVVPFIPKI